MIFETCFAKNFERFIAIKNAKRPEIITVPIIIVKSVRVISERISFIATAAPVRVRPITKRVMKLRPITIVFIPPKRTKKPLFDCSKSSDPITAACPAPIPGRKEQSGAEIIAPRVALVNSFREIFIFFKGGIF